MDGSRWSLCAACHVARSIQMSDQVCHANSLHDVAAEGGGVNDEIRTQAFIPAPLSLCGSYGDDSMQPCVRAVPAPSAPRTETTAPCRPRSAASGVTAGQQRGALPTSVGCDHTKASGAIGTIRLNCLSVSCRSQPTLPQITIGGALLGPDALNACNFEANYCHDLSCSVLKGSS